MEALKDFKATGEITPAGGICFTSTVADAVAIKYHNKVKIFTDRRPGFENHGDHAVFFNTKTEIAVN